MTHEITVRGRRGGKVDQACGRCGRDYATIYAGYRLGNCSWSRAGVDGAALMVNSDGDDVLLLGKVEITRFDDAAHLPVWGCA